MPQIVSITSQGQITIPAFFRRLLGLDNYRKAIIKTEDNKLIIEPIPDLLQMAGSISHKAMKNKTISQIIAAEEKEISRLSTNKYRTK